MSDNSSIVSHPPKSSHSTSPSHSPVVRTIVRTLKKGFRRYHQLLVTSPKSLDFKPFRASILLDSRQKNYRLHVVFVEQHLATVFSIIIYAEFKSDSLQDAVIFLSKPTVFECFITTPDIDLELSSAHVK